MDAGCEFNGYSSDITRTWPVLGGKFSDPQRIIYQIVYETQQDLKMHLQNGIAQTVDGLYDSMRVLLADKLFKAGLMEEGMSKGEMLGRVSEFCPHHVSHYLGMDVHDTALVPKSAPLEPGMIITLEPGIYIPNEGFRPPIRKEFRGFGVRIEDDVLIEAGMGVRVLSEDCPSQIDEIEGLCQGKS